MRPLDGHVHVGFWRVPDFQGHGSTLKEAVALYRRWNWGGILLLPTDAADNLGLLDELDSVASGPLTLRPAWWVSPDDPLDLPALRRNTHRVAALKLHPSLIRRPATDPVFLPYLSMAAEFHLPVVIHCGRWQEMAGFRLALAAAERFPEASFLLAHMGGDSPALVMNTVSALESHGYPNVWLGTESIREPWLLEHAIRRLGSSRLVFGSDYNLNHPEPFRRLIEVLDIDDAQRTDIMRNNLNGLMPEGKKFF